MTAVKDRLVKLNKEINWKPKATGEGRFANWLENVNDWNLSRSRYWGIPLPIWRTEDLREELAIGSVEELMQEIQKSYRLPGFNDFQSYEGFCSWKANEERIRPYRCMVRNSGSNAHMRTITYPFENKELIDERKAFPADFIAEGVDQTRGWFYTLHAIGTAVFDSVAYKNVMSNGLVLDKNGQKMSKRLGNAIDPFKTLETYGPDATRYASTGEQINAVSELVKQEVNVKELQLINAEEASHLIVKQIKPNFKTLGPKLGKDMKIVAAEISAFSDDQIAALEKEGSLTIQGYEITTDDVEILTKDIPGWTVASEGKLTVALDLTLTDDLKAEGIAREFINRVQNLRKEKNFEISDRILIELDENNSFLSDILKNKDYISAAVLANDSSG
ncbi:hypothetical protein FQR65_LT19418 [Abscondita terminalis]|nr:hypothetical protein FQR65_LT19418 [Abscondita terminalis]